MFLSDLTTISEFRHPDLASTVALVGNYHEGSESYMASLNEQLEIYEARGSVVHYEEVQFSTTEELASEPLPIQKIHDLLQSLITTPVSNEPPNIVTIIDPKLGSWENYDATAIQLSRYIHKRPLQRLALFTFSEILRTLHNAPETRREKLYNKLGSAAGWLTLAGLYPPLVTYRNNIALQAVDTALEKAPDQDVTLLWGQDHVKGLTHGLFQRGFHRTYVAAYSSEEYPHDKD